MLRFWLRVNARLHDDESVRAFAGELYPRLKIRVAVHIACGHLLALWGRVVDEQEDGNVSKRADHTLEEWARWDGKTGAFAKCFRTRFTDSSGMIAEWDVYQGKLIERRAADRRRKSGGNSAGRPVEVPQEVGRKSDGVPLPNGNGHDHPLGSAPNSAESQEGAPGALAPSGARTAPRGERTPGAPPMRDDPDFKRYMARLVERCEEEFAADPDLVIELEAEARQGLALAPRKVLPEWQMRVVRDGMYELLRKRRDWSSFDDWLNKRGLSS